MGSFLLRGGRPLSGTVPIRGSKNAATKLMVASLLTEEPCTIENVPFSEDLDITRELCESIGSRVELDPNHRCQIETRLIRHSRVPELSRRNRIPILALGPLLHRSGVAEVPVLGGCPIGHRPINFHLEALRRMGVRIERRVHSYYAEADDIRGTEIKLPYPSVGATESVILTAVRARGRTVLSNAATEPEIQNLISLLRAMGASIQSDATSRRVVIEGVPALSGATVRVIPDRTEIVSFAVAGLATGGEVRVTFPDQGAASPGDVQSGIAAFLDQLDAIGARYTLEPDAIRFWQTQPLRSTIVETAPHPGFMTDWQQPFLVLLTQCHGSSQVHETVYEDRFGYTKDLGRMGAAVRVSDECPPARGRRSASADEGPLPNPCRFQGQTFQHTATVTGPRTLSAAPIHIPDIRAGMAQVIAALIATGESTITGIEHLDRGYEKLDERLQELGADIERVSS